MIEPITTEMVNARPVRFFVPPAAEPEAPWFALLDLLAAIELNDAGQLYFLQLLRGGPYRDRTIVIATVDGPVVIARSDVGTSLLGVLERRGLLLPGVDDDFRQARLRALWTAADGNDWAALGIAATTWRRYAPAAARVIGATDAVTLAGGMIAAEGNATIVAEAIAE